MPERATFLFVLVTSFGVASCQVLAGVSDKELDPSLSGDGGFDASQDSTDDVAKESAGDVAEETAEDVGSDVNHDGPEGGGDPEPLYPPVPPERPDVGSASDAGAARVLTFAVRRFFLGSIDPESDVRTFEAWRQFGFDIDGYCTTLGESQGDSSGVCHKPPMATALCHEDAMGCRDNTVGHLIADVLQFSTTDFERTLHSRTNAGAAQSLIVQLQDVGDGADDPYVPAYVYVSAPTEFPPLWDGTDVLAVDEQSVLGSVDAPKYVFDAGYIRNHVWVSGEFNESPAVVPIVMMDKVVEVATDTATLVIQLDGNNTVGKHAMFSAVLEIEPLVPLLERGVLEATNCNQSLADLAINGYFLPSRDLVSGGSPFVDPSATCDRQSFALLFDLATVQPPVEAVAVEPPDPTCE